MRCASCHSKLHRGNRVAMTSNNNIHHERCYYQQYLRPAADVRGGAYNQPGHLLMNNTFVQNEIRTGDQRRQWTTKNGDTHSGGEGAKWKFKSDTPDGPFRCRLKCMQCIGKTREGTRCERKTCTTLPFCPMHLKKHAHLRVGRTSLKDNNRPRRRLPFAGLFACDPTQKKGEIVFKEDSWIVAYIGDKMTKNGLDARYPQDDTAPYAVTRQYYPNQIWDGACSRGVANFANDAHGVNGRHNNAYLVYGTSMMGLRATEDIRNGDEILTSYGNEYWQHKPLPFHTAPTKAHRKRKQKCGGKSRYQ